jgi:uncharacterized repeat protein (TIGR01451 family)
MNLNKKLLSLALVTLLLLPLASLPATNVPSAQANPGITLGQTVNNVASVSTPTGTNLTFRYTFQNSAETNSATLATGLDTVNFFDIVGTPILTWTDTVAGGFPRSTMVTAKVKDTVPVGMQIQVYATAYMHLTAGTDENFTTLLPLTITVVAGQPKLLVQKQTVTPVDGIVASGGQQTFRITATNPSSTIGAGAPVITDILPTSFDAASVTGISASVGTTATTPVYTHVGNTLYFTFPTATIPSGSYLSVYFTANALTTSATTPFTNVAQASATGFALSDAQVSGSIIPGATTFTKTANKTVAAPGDTITYTIQLNNVGQAAFTSAQIVDYIPTYTVFQSASFVSPPVGSSITLPDLTAGRNWVTWNLGGVATSAQVTAILNVRVINDPNLMGNTVSNTAQFTGYQNSILVQKSASSPTVSISAAPFTITKTVSPTYAQPGQYVSFGIKVKNNSLTTAVNNFTVTDNLDSRLVNPGVGAASSLAGTISGNQVTWGGTGTTIQPNTEMNFYFTAMVNYNLTPGTQIPNTGQVSGQISSTPTLPAGGSSNTVYVIVGLPTSLSLVKSVSSSSVQPGTPAQFTITCSNPTTNPTVGITITDTLPSPLTFQSATGVYTQSIGIVTWTATLNPGQTENFSLTALLAQTATIGVSIGNTAVVSIGGTQLATSTATFTVGQVPASPLVISKLATADSALPGEPITYLINFANNGSSLLNNVQIIDYFPIGTAYLNGSPPPIIDTANNRVVWNIGDVTPGDTGLVSVQFTVPATATSGMIIGNQAVGTASGYQDVVTPSVFVTVGQVLHHGFIKGYPDGTFRPQNQITRAEVAAMLSRILGTGSSTGANFSDLPTNHWAYGYISAVVNAGLFNGYPDGTFRPDQSITRAELSKVMVLMRNLFPIQVSPPTFPDIAGHWAINSIEMASRAGFVTGYPSGDFRPDQPITRAETVTLICRAFGRGPLRGANVALSFPDVPNNWMFEWIAEAAQSHYGVHNAIDNTETLISYFTEPMP